MLARTWEWNSQAEIESALKRADDKPVVCFSRLHIAAAGLHPVAKVERNL